MSAFVDSLEDSINALAEFPTPALHATSDQIEADQFYRLSYNESAYGASPRVIDAIQETLPYIGMYPAMRDDGLRETLQQTYQRGLSAANFYAACSGYETMELLARAFFRPDDEIIIMPPTFPVYDRLTNVHLATLVEVPLHPDDFSVDVVAVLDAITPRTRAIFLCNPNNPTGTFIPADAMAHLMREVPDHVLVISDEVYFHYATHQDYPDNMQYVLDGANIVLVHSFSKGYGLAGMRMGYGIAPEAIATYVRKFYRGFHLNILQLSAGIAALKDAGHLQKNVMAAIEGRQAWYQHCEQLGLRYWPSQTNFILIDIGQPAKAIAQQMLSQGILVSTVGQYPTYLRISMGKPEANEVCMAALSAALEAAS